jgi:arylsulfatase A-like enzyme
VLLVLSDDHSAAHVGAYGNTDIKTPNLDAFAKDGMRFERAYVAAPQCVPSRAALMTGRSPVALQMTRFSAPLPEEYKTGWSCCVPWLFCGRSGRTFHLDGSANQPAETKVVLTSTTCAL